MTRNMENPMKHIVAFKNGVVFKVKDGKVAGIFPKTLSRFLGAEESELPYINQAVCKKVVVEYRRTITYYDGTSIKINRNDAVYECNNKELQNSILGRPSSIAQEVIEEAIVG